uniref:C-type lectin 5 n=2 Tax=Perca flavescens TaxID=8167 RepID=C3UZY2_PERFV|nr:C-type lectin 5 [Perca flavescens]
MASGFPFALLLCLSIGLLAPSCHGRPSCPEGLERCYPSPGAPPSPHGLFTLTATGSTQSLSSSSSSPRTPEHFPPPSAWPSTVLQPTGHCPPGWTQFGSRCFSFNIQRKSWTDAENFCKAAGGNLASVHSEEEHEFLRTFIKQVSGLNRRTWIGGSDSVQEGVWQWSDGSPFNYRRWHVGLPDNLFLVEHCLHMNFLGMTWNDDWCAKIFPFLCSKKL